MTSQNNNHLLDDFVDDSGSDTEGVEVLEEPRPPTPLFDYDDSPDDVALIKEKDNTHLLQNSNNNRTCNNKENNGFKEVNRIMEIVNQKPPAMEEEEVLVVTQTATQTARMLKWPKMEHLVLQYTDAAFALLGAVDNTGATAEVKAFDNSSVKGNKWVKLLDACHGGGEKGSTSRGRMSEWGFPALEKATAMKQKVQQCWKYCLANKQKCDVQLYEIAKRQATEYKATVETQKSNSKKDKQQAAQIQLMLKYASSSLTPPSLAVSFCSL